MSMKVNVYRRSFFCPISLGLSFQTNKVRRRRPINMVTCRQSSAVSLIPVWPAFTFRSPQTNCSVLLKLYSASVTVDIYKEEDLSKPESKCVSDRQIDQAVGSDSWSKSLPSPEYRLWDRHQRLRGHRHPGIFGH